VSSKADRHYSRLPAHWGGLYYMYTLQHMVHLSDGGNAMAFIEGGIRLGDRLESLLPRFTSAPREVAHLEVSHKKFQEAHFP